MRVPERHEEKDTVMTFPDADRELSNRVSIVGVGNSDFAFDYETARSRKSDPVHNMADQLALTSLERALADSGLTRRDVDAVGFSYFVKDYSTFTPELASDALGLRPRHADLTMPIMMGVVPHAVAMLARKEFYSFALIYSAPMRSIRRAFGGDTENYGPPSYYYYHPWGWSSQGAHWALKAQRYLSQYGYAERDLGVVATTLRDNAGRSDFAIMQEPIAIEDYLSSRYVVKPLHLLDMCLVSDASVCLILKRTEDSTGLRTIPVRVSGWGRAEAHGEMFKHMVVNALRDEYQEAARQALDMAGLDIAGIRHFEGYDAASIHLINQIEGYGLAAPGEALAMWADGHMKHGGHLGVSTSGGMMSEAYTQGWGQVLEAVHQLRHEAGARQLRDLTASMTSLSTPEGAYPLVFTRGDA